MAPLVESFPPTQLTERVQQKADGKRRKPPLDLKECKVKEMLQYFCDLDGPAEDRRSRVVCVPCLWVFRRCPDGLTVETTSWEGVYDGSTTAAR